MGRSLLDPLHHLRDLAIVYLSLLWDRIHFINRPGQIIYVRIL